MDDIYTTSVCPKSFSQLLLSVLRKKSICGHGTWLTAFCFLQERVSSTSWKSADQEGFQGPLVGKEDTYEKDFYKWQIIRVMNVCELLERKSTTIIQFSWEVDSSCGLGETEIQVSEDSTSSTSEISLLSESARLVAGCPEPAGTQWGAARWPHHPPTTPRAWVCTFTWFHLCEPAAVSSRSLRKCSSFKLYTHSHLLTEEPARCFPSSPFVGSFSAFSNFKSCSWNKPKDK